MPKWTRPSEAMPDWSVDDTVVCIHRDAEGNPYLSIYYNAECVRLFDPNLFDECELWAYESDVCQIADYLAKARSDDDAR